MEATTITLPTAADGAIRALSQREWMQVVSSLGLSPKQARIVQLILEGKGDKQIAREMGLSFGTVRAHLSRAFDRTGLRGRMELAAGVFAQVSAKRKSAQEKRR